ncbi:hypothetical protein [Rheinheimera salexigens]|uniref:hypothetical protein n=1 Tax=Rheinheimera salexigens TaxID=1628148 RepID=UPI00114CF8DC|nr:hypothetical protein [Rheinheimera salexigens]
MPLTAVYRKFSQGNGWENSILNNSNQLLIYDLPAQSGVLNWWSNSSQYGDKFIRNSDSDTEFYWAALLCHQMTCSSMQNAAN